jgi:uncharacterized protein with HEPN domain
MNAERWPVEGLIDACRYANQARSLADTGSVQPSTSDMLAIRYCLLVVGEALDRVPGTVLSQDTAMPWRKVIALRHRLAHGYWLIDEAILIQIARSEIEALIEALNRLISKLK